MDHHIRGQGCVDCLEFLGDRCRHNAAVFSDPHDRGADDNFGSVLRRRAHANSLTRLDGGHLLDRDRHAIACRDNSSSQFSGIADQCVGTHRQTFAVAVYKAAAHAGVVLLQCIAKFGQGYAKRGQLLHIGHYKKLLGIAADRIDAGKAWGALEQRGDNPVLCRSQIGRLVDFGRQPLTLGRDIATVRLLARFARLVLVIIAVV